MSKKYTDHGRRASKCNAYRAFKQECAKRDREEMKAAGKKLRKAQADDEKAAQIAREAQEPISKLWSAVFWLMWECTRWRNGKF